MEVNHPSEVEEIFDEISYEKGASVILMIYNYLGKQVHIILVTMHLLCVFFVDANKKVLKGSPLFLMNSNEMMANFYCPFFSFDVCQMSSNGNRTSRQDFVCI